MTISEKGGTSGEKIISNPIDDCVDKWVDF